MKNLLQFKIQKILFYLFLSFELSCLYTGIIPYLEE